MHTEKKLMQMTGTIANAAAVVCGAVLGMLIGGRLPRKVIDTVFQGIGLFTLAIGMQMALQAQHFIVVVVSIVAGSALGCMMNLDRGVRAFSSRLESRFSSGSGSGRFADGMVTAAMLFCVGSMSILGAIEDGTGQTPVLLYTKSVMDGISSVALAAGMGAGVAFAAVPLLLYQGALTLLAGAVAPLASGAMIADMTGTGGVLLLGMGLNILNIKQISVIDMLPALAVALAVSAVV